VIILTPTSRSSNELRNADFTMVFLFATNG